MYKALAVAALLLPASLAGCYSEGRYAGPGVPKSPVVVAAAPAPSALAGTSRALWVCVPEEDIECPSINSFEHHRVCAKDGSGWGECVDGKANAKYPFMRPITSQDGVLRGLGDPVDLPEESAR